MEFAYKEVSSNQQMFVVEGLRSNLLGLLAIKALNLAARLDETTARPTLLSQAYIHQKFAKLFQGLGKLGDEYQIQLEPGATPFALFTPRRVPLALRERVSKELQRMEAMRVISRVDVPTPWCAGLLPQRSQVE